MKQFKLQIMFEGFNFYSYFFFPITMINNHYYYIVQPTCFSNSLNQNPAISAIHDYQINSQHSQWNYKYQQNIPAQLQFCHLDNLSTHHNQSYSPGQENANSYGLIQTTEINRTQQQLFTGNENQFINKNKQSEVRLKQNKTKNKKRQCPEKKKRKPNRFNFISLSRYWKRLQENFNLTNDQITDLQFEFNNYGDFKKWYRSCMEKIYCSNDKRDSQSFNQQKQEDLNAGCEVIPINQQDKIKKFNNQCDHNYNQNPEDKNIIEESICTNLSCQNTIKQLTQENLQQKEKYEQTIQILEKDRDEWMIKYHFLEKQILQNFAETIDQNEIRIKKIQENDSSEDELPDQNIDGKLTNFDTNYLLQRQAWTKKKIQQVVQDLNRGKKQKNQLKFFDWGMRQTVDQSISYQGDILKGKLWEQVISDCKKGLIGNLFDVIVADAPWDSTAINLNYETLTDSQFMAKIPIHKLQQNGYLFLWITNKKLEAALQYLERIGYERIEIITWIKISKENLLRNNIGFYLRHFIEFCLVARKKGPFTELAKISKTHRAPNIIVEKVTEASRKPDQLYEIIEELCPNGKYLEIFGRVHNQRQKWVTIGNESITRKKPKQEKARRRLQKQNLKRITPKNLYII